MDSKEDILSALDEFNQQDADKVPPLLERYLNRIAATGETLFAWPKLRPLFLHKLNSVMKEFFEKVPTDDLPTCPNVENVKFEEIRQRLILTINEFNGAPFTIQRLCELITNPWKHYKRTDKFMRGLEKNLLVVSTVDPYGNKIVTETSKVLVNGLDANGYETDKVSPDTPERSFFPPPVPCSSPNTNGTGIHGAGDASTSSTSSPSSSWFASSSVVDSPCSWGGGPAGAGMVDSSCSLGESSVHSATLPTPSTEELSLRTESDSASLEPSLSTPNDADMSQSSSESSGSGSSEHSTTPPLDDIDKDSEDSDQSTKTLESSSSDCSLNEAEAEQSQPEPSTSVEITAEVAATETSPESLGEDPVTTSIPQEDVETESDGIIEEPEEADVSGDETRESTKRSIDQDHTETQNKRLRIDVDDNVSQSSDVESSSETQSKGSPATSPIPDSDADQSFAPAADSQSQDEPDKSASMEDDSTQEAQPAEVQEGRDSQDSLGFDTPITSDAEAAPIEESTSVSPSKPEEEAATSSTSPDSDSPDSGSKPDLPESAQEAITEEAVPCEVSASDQSVDDTPDQTVQESASAAVPQENASADSEEPAVSSASWEPQDKEPEESKNSESSKSTDESTLEPESISHSEDSSQISQSADVCQSSLQTETSMDVN